MLRDDEHLSHRYFGYLNLAKASREMWLSSPEHYHKWRENAPASSTPQLTAGLASELP